MSRIKNGGLGQYGAGRLDPANSSNLE